MQIRIFQVFLIVVSLLVVAPLPAQGGDRGSAADATSLTDVELGYVTFMREEEKLARDVYITLGDSWGLVVFDNIAVSEQQHMDGMKTVIDKYGIDDPVADENNVGSFVNEELSQLYPALVERGAQSRYEALMVGALIEEVDMEDIQAAIDATDNIDIVRVYESLLCGSRNHLRAFVGQIESDGRVYESQLYPDDTEWVAFIDSIIDSPVERNCGAHTR